MPVTIKDIAREAGISASSVSKALNSKSDISEDLKKRVRTIADELGYKKNVLASRLVTMKSNTIGVFIFSRTKIKNTESSAFAYINTMLDTVKDRGYDIVLFSIDSNYSTSKSYIDLCIERCVEGAIFIGFEMGDPHLTELMESDFPVVMIEMIATGTRISCVTVDNRKGIQLGLAYLLDLGHTEIGFIKGHHAAELSVIRHDMYCNIMQKHGLYNTDYIFEGDFSMDSGYKIGNEIAALDKRPSAVFSSNDLMAIGLIKSLGEHGIAVPTDISIIGFDNFSISKYITPPLTTISQNFSEIAIRAVEILFDMIHNNVKPRDIYLDPELIVRDSCKRKEPL